MKFDVETHCWLYNDDLDWFWKRQFHPHHSKPVSSGGISENANLPNTDVPTHLTISDPPIWINSPYLKETDKQKILSYIGKTVITIR